MHGQAYLTSAEHAANVGSFDGFALNREPMLQVMEMHRDAVEAIDASAPAELRAAASAVWDECLDAGPQHGYRNSQVTVLAPTGTIAFMMDCDTTGIEPDIALVKYKQLAGGGMLKIVNRTVPMALQKLGYDEPTIRGILDHIDEHDTIEQAPGLQGRAPAGLRLRVRPAARGPEHPLPRPPEDDGRRAAVPLRGDLQDLQRAQRGHRRGHPRRLPRRLEARPQGPGHLPRRLEGEPARLHQGRVRRRRRPRKPHRRAAAPWPERPPRGAGPSPAPPPAPQVIYQPRRERLPHTRRSLTHKFDIQGHEGYINVGFYPDGRPGELFITMAKEGSTIGGLMDVLGTAISIGLQYGVPLEVFVNKFAHSRFEPAGFTKNPDIPIAKSIADYIFRWLGMEFIPGYREANAPKRPGRRGAGCAGGRAAPVIKVNGHRTATIADLEHAEAVMGAKVQRPAAVPQTFGGRAIRSERRPQRAGPPVRPLPERRPRLRQLRRPDRPLRHLLPLLQLRQQHGVLVIGC